MNTKQLEKILTDGGIEPKIELSEAKIEIKMLLKHFLGVSDVDLVLNDEFEDNEDVLKAVNERVQTRKPIQHIIGLAHFMGEDFIVNENVLIPRDETEILVRKAVEILEAKRQKGKNEREECSSAAQQLGSSESSNLSCSPVHPFTHSPSKVLDIGTGSGCIACMVAKLSGAQSIGVDISTDALGIALDNSSKLNLFNKAIFRKSDIFSNVKEKFDMIISNPPYIPLSEKNKLQKEVSYDPDLALFAENEGLDFYEKITSQASDFLNEGGYLMFELGIGQADSVKGFMQKAGFKDIQIEFDLSGIERVIFGQI